MESSDIDSEAFFSDTDITLEEVLLTLFENRKYSNRDIEQFFEILETFVSSWDEPLPIEPVLLSALMDEYLIHPSTFTGKKKSFFANRTGWHVKKSSGGRVDLVDLSQNLLNLSVKDLGAFDYRSWSMPDYFSLEYKFRVENRTVNLSLPSVLSTYADRIVLSARSVKSD